MNYDVILTYLSSIWYNLIEKRQENKRYTQEECQKKIWEEIYKIKGE